MNDDRKQPQDPEEANQALGEMMGEHSRKLDEMWNQLRSGGRPNVPLEPEPQEDNDPEAQGPSKEE